MRWVWAVGVLLVAGCATPSTTPTTTTSVAILEEDPSSWFKAKAVALSWEGPPVAAAPFLGQKGGSMEERVTPADPFNVTRGPQAPSPGSTTSFSTYSDTVYLPDWTVEGVDGAVVVREQQATEWTPAKSAVLWSAASGDELPLAAHGLACPDDRHTSNYPCDLARLTFDVEPRLRADGSLSRDRCLSGLGQFPDATALPFPLEAGTSWESDAIGILGLPVRQVATVVGFASISGSDEDAVHVRAHQTVLTAWVPCQAPAETAVLLGTDRLTLEADVDIYYVPSLAHVALVQANATFSIAAAGAVQDDAEPLRSGTLLVERRWHPFDGDPAGDAYGDYEATLAYLNAGKALRATGSGSYFDVAVDPPVTKGEVGKPMTFTASFSSETWPVEELPSGLHWAWSSVSAPLGPNTLVRDDGPTHDFTPPAPGTYSVAAILSNGQYQSGQGRAWVAVDATGAFEAVCDDPTSINVGSYAPCASTSFTWAGGLMTRIVVHANVTPPVAGGRIVVGTAEYPEVWTAPSDIDGRAVLDVETGNAQLLGNITVGWQAYGSAVGQTAQLTYRAYALEKPYWMQ